MVGSISVARSSSGDLTVAPEGHLPGLRHRRACAIPPITKMVNVVLPSPGAGAPNAGGASARAAPPRRRAAQSAPQRSCGSRRHDSLSSPSRTDWPSCFATATWPPCWRPSSARPAALPHALRAADDSHPVGNHRRPGRQGDTRMRGFSLAFTYVQGMALTYAAAGACFVLAFKQAPQAFFQQPWIVAAVRRPVRGAGALPCSGFYTLQMPQRIADSPHGRQQPTEVRAPMSAASSWARFRRWWSPLASPPR